MHGVWGSMGVAFFISKGAWFPARFANEPRQNWLCTKRCMEAVAKGIMFQSGNQKPQTVRYGKSPACRVGS